MPILDQTLNTEHENLALDEALLLAHDTSSGNASWLRFWEYSKPFVVLGRSSKQSEEVNVTACEQIKASVLRRVSGGATIVTGPGCLMYAVVLNTDTEGKKLTVDSAHRYVLGRMTEALSQFCPTVKIAGTSDLVYEADQSADDGSAELIKFSGNSVRLVRNRLLYHGTLLYDFDLTLIEELLLIPPRQPDYRNQRSHKSFVGNLKATRQELVHTISNVWKATSAGVLSGTNSQGSIQLPEGIRQQVQNLVTDKYQCDHWNLGR